MRGGYGRVIRVQAVLMSGFALAFVAAAQDINFRDLSRPGAPVVKQYTVTGTQEDGRRYVLQFEGMDGDRIASMNSLRSAGRSSDDSGSTAKSSSGGSWKVKRQYMGGFSEFGADRPRMVTLIQCGSGAEHKLYVGGNGKWTGVGMSFGSYDSLDVAAQKFCR